MFRLTKLIITGSLGTAILQGLLSEKRGKVKPKRVLASVTSQSSADKVVQSFTKSSVPVEACPGQNYRVAEHSEVVILACPPNLMSDVLRGLDKPLKKKLLISVLAGVTTKSIEKSTGPECHVVRVLPNLAVAQNASATAVEDYADNMPKDIADLATAIVEQLGGMTSVPASVMNASTVTCGSTPAFIALFLDGLIDGAVASGVPREKANSMIAQVLTSTCVLLSQGPRASQLRESICAMPGCTIRGNIALEQGNVRGAAATAMITAIEAAAKLG